MSEKPQTQHAEEASEASSIKDELREDILLRDAKDATSDEHELTLSDAFKYHKKAILWAVIISATIIMEGYDLVLMSSFYGYPTFQKKYGEMVEGGGYELSGPWQSGLGAASSCGTIFGVFANGYLCERYGHKRVILVALVFMTGFIFITFFAKDSGMLVAGQVLCGLPWGVFATMGPTYASEVCPMALRGYLTAYINMCWAIGQFIAAGVLKGLVNNPTQWGFRIPFAVQWAWPVPLFVAIYFAPDSPWWLVRKGRTEDAVKSVKRLSHPSIHFKSHQQVALMIYTNNLEKEQQQVAAKGVYAYLDCLKSINLRRTEISCLVMAGQTLSGTAFAYSPSYFFRQAGLNANDTYKLNLGVTGIAFTGTFCSWFLLHRFGRRTIYVTGYGVLCLCLLLIGILDKPAESNHSIKWAQAGICMVWVATYALTIGPLAFTIVSEMSATRLRAPTIALARNCYNLAQLISHVVEPYLINPTEANLKGKTAFLWLATALPTFIWAFFRLPESKNRTYEELDLLFEKRISARKFSEFAFEGELNVEEKGATA